jgi:cytochrome c oxidase cbb3-type subunit 3
MKPLAILLLLGVLPILSCEREKRDFRPPPGLAGLGKTITMSELQPGQAAPPIKIGNPYEGRAADVSAGMTLYQAYNCNGCHSNGGGGIGPPLMDEKWIYGGEPANIVATVLEGRPNGMPSFRGKIPEYQVWQLAAYVRSMSGQLAKGVSPQRSDHMSAKPAESSTPKEGPVQSAVPPSAVQPQ